MMLLKLIEYLIQSEVDIAFFYVSSAFDSISYLDAIRLMKYFVNDILHNTSWLSIWFHNTFGDCKLSDIFPSTND